MRSSIFYLFLSTLLLFSGCQNERRDLVNTVIGNISFVEKFGFEPDENTDNQLRVKTHLEYVEQLLRNKDVSGLSAELKNKRTQLLDHLRRYAAAGKYPKNYDYASERKSCFIDRDKTICAVGYLIEKTAGRDAAERINADFQYVGIFEMKSKTVDEWIASSGLTKEECAMIQPQYGSFPNYEPIDNRIKPFYAISSTVLMGANATFNVVNIVDLAKGTGSKTAPVLGFLAGTSQVAMGAFGFARERKLTAGYNESTLTGQGKLSLFNIGMGTTTILLSSWNLIKQKKAAEQRTSWNVFGYPAGGKAVAGVSFRAKI